MTGYRSREYARSLGGWGEVLALDGCGGHVLLRQVRNSVWRDGTGCYPIFSCRRWSALEDDVKQLPPDLISLTLVTDPFCPLAEPELRQIFRVVRPMGEHYIVDLPSLSAGWPSRHHRRKLREVPPDVEIAIVDDPPALLDDWSALYDTLSQRHGIRGIRRFSPAIFGAQLDVPGAVIFAAWLSDRLLGMDWYFQDGERVFAHLSAYSEEGYRCSVSYPMMAAAIDHFKTRASALDLGGTPSVSASDSGGLIAFKAGWATRALPSYLCGVDLLPDEYERLSGGRFSSEGNFFPYYRRDEY
jgi:Acetyltransferase (GNAT) domain